MKNLKKETTNNNFRNNKFFPIIAVIVAVAFVVGMGVLYYYVQNKIKENETIDIEYQEYTTVTAPHGQEYETTDEYGNKYWVRDDGMYCETDVGYVKVEYNEPIGKFNTYRYELYSGTTVEFSLYRDGTYRYTMNYGEGNTDIATGKYTIVTGVDKAFDALQIENMNEFEEAFFYNAGAINPNDLFVVTLKLDKYETYDCDGNIVQSNDDAVDTYESSKNENNGSYRFNDVVDQLVIYLSKDSDGNVIGTAYDTYNSLLLNQDQVNGSFEVDFSEKGEKSYAG